MIKPKLVVSDIDGTLLKNSEVIPRKIVLEIKRIQKKGIFFTFATGRPLFSINSILSQITPNAPIISNSGFDIYYSYKKTIKNLNKFKDSSLKVIVKHFLSRNIDIRIVKHNKIYARLNMIDKDNDLFFRNYKETFEDITNINYTNVGKLSFYAASEKETKLILDEFTKLKEFKGAKATVIKSDFSPSYFIDILPRGTTKGEALRLIQSELNIKAKETAIIINGNNDLDMIKYCSLIVAPEDAERQVKLKANIKTKKAENLGALEYLKSL